MAESKNSDKVEVYLERVYPDGARYSQTHICARGKKTDDYINGQVNATKGSGVRIENIRKRDV